MSILTETLPDFVIVRGKKCPIRSDFKAWLEFSEIINKNISEAEKLFKMFKLVFEELPPNMYDGISAMMKFYSYTPTQKKTNEKSINKNYFDFEYDANLIYSAFLQQYKVDLCHVDMHWWTFKALLGGLSDDTHFIKVVQYRSMDLSKIKDKEQKRYYQKMKALYKLPDNRSEEQKEQHLNDVMESMF